MLTHKKLLELIAKEKKYTFISTGMSTIKNIEEELSQKAKKVEEGRGFNFVGEAGSSKSKK